MLSRARLSFDVPAPAVGDGRIVLDAAYDVPILWAAGFAEDDLQVEPPASGEVLRIDDDDAPRSSNERFFFVAPLGPFRERLGPIASGVARSDDPWLRTVLGGAAELAASLASLADDALVVLDANAVAALAPRGVIRVAISSRIQAFDALRGAWSDPGVKQLLCALRPDVLRGALSHDVLRARRVTDAKADRTAFFALLLGDPSGPSAGALHAWLAEAPSGPHLRPLVEEARLIAEMLAARGVVLAEGRQGEALRYLALAARLRTPVALREILDLLQAQGLAEIASPVSATYPSLDEALRDIVQVLDAS